MCPLLYHFVGISHQAIPPPYQPPSPSQTLNPSSSAHSEQPVHQAPRLSGSPFRPSHRQSNKQPSLHTQPRRKMWLGTGPPSTVRSPPPPAHKVIPGTLLARTSPHQQSSIPLSNHAQWSVPHTQWSVSHLQCSILAPPSSSCEAWITVIVRWGARTRAAGRALNVCQMPEWVADAVQMSNARTQSPSHKGYTCR